jgi:hypothetical protein
LAGVLAKDSLVVFMGCRQCFGNGRETGAKEFGQSSRSWNRRFWRFPRTSRKECSSANTWILELLNSQIVEL